MMRRSEMWSECLAIVKDFYFAIQDSIQNKIRRRYEFEVQINAPREMVWQAMWSAGNLSQYLPVSYRVEPLNGSKEGFQVRFRIFQDMFSCPFQIIEKKDGEAILAAHLEDESVVSHENNARPLDSGPQEDASGTDFSSSQLVAVALEEEDQATRLRQFYEFKFEGFWSRIYKPLLTRWLVRHFKSRCEQEQCVVSEMDNNDIMLCAASGAIAFFGCWYFYDLSWAIVVLMALSTHEFGHVLAIRSLGMRVSGLHFVPFIGGLYLSKSKFGNHFHSAFSFLMGPAMGLIPTLGLFGLFLATENLTLGIAAALFALINLINLAPVEPIGGGQILRAIIGSLPQRDAVSAGWAILTTGFALALYEQSYIFAAIVAFATYQIWDFSDEFQSDEQQAQIQAQIMSPAQLSAVALGAVLVAFLHGLILMQSIRNPLIAGFLGF